MKYVDGPVVNYNKSKYDDLRQLIFCPNTYAKMSNFISSLLEIEVCRTVVGFKFRNIFV